ncbi:hypothetical protein ONJ17_26755, partial [Salmonella enterica subsp. enterica serovar Agona]|nr:hypothetical protein [Salmonella enterica subsp. enterica serovar Agona]
MIAQHTFQRDFVLWLTGGEAMRQVAAGQLRAVDRGGRYLRFLGYKLKYVRNITDIDDKIIKRANENGESFVALVDRMI